MGRIHLSTLSMLLLACQSERANQIIVVPDAGDGIVCASGFRRSGAAGCVPDYGSNCRLAGLGFSPFTGQQDPDRGAVVTATQVRQRLELVADATRRIRTYTSRNGQESTCRMAREMGLGFDQGVWLGPDDADNARELASMVEIVRTCPPDAVIVGNEVLTRKDLPVRRLLETIALVRASVPAGVLVTTAEVWHYWLEYPELVAAVDVLYVHDYPFWDQVPESAAVTSLAAHYDKLVAVAGGRRVLIAETGWPTDGLDDAPVPTTPADAVRYRQEFVSWANHHQVAFHYFAAFDEAWKVKEGSFGPSWGIFDENGNPKDGLLDLLRDPTTCH